MVKRLLFVCCTSLMLMILGSCSHDDEDIRNSVKYQGKEIAYLPQSVSDFPEWILPYLHEGKTYCIVCVGSKDNETIYNIYNYLSSSTEGWFFDENGNYIAANAGFFEEIKDWRCIYYKE